MINTDCWARPAFDPSLGRNRVLDALKAATSHRISPHLQSVMRERGAVVCESEGFLDYAYFPAGSVLSLLTVLDSGSVVETANVGTEGAFGLSAALSSSAPFVRCLVQLAGALIRCPIGVLQEEVERSAAARDICGSYSESILMQVQQNMVCNGCHDMTERLCRWLLMMHDRAGREVLAYPQSFFADIMGEDRQSVMRAAESMQADELITYRRGAIQIVDRSGLEKASCECYAILAGQSL